MASFDFKKPSNFYDEMFGANSDVGASAKAKEEIAVEYLVEIENQPFNRYSDEQLRLLSEDIKLNGLMSPLIVHKMQGSQMYEILAGRNRFNACRMLDMKSIPCIIKEDLSKPQRDLILVNSNLMQRQTLLPSERARAYKMQSEAYKELGVKPNESAESKANVYKYIRLNNLCCELLEKVDKGDISFTIGYELSGLDLSAQNVLIDYLYTKPNTQLITEFIETIKELSARGRVDLEDVRGVFEKEKDTSENEDKISKATTEKPSKLVIKMDEFRSELKRIAAKELKNFILESESELLEMYKKSEEEKAARW